MKFTVMILWCNIISQALFVNYPEIVTIPIILLYLKYHSSAFLHSDLKLKLSSMSVKPFLQELKLLRKVWSHIFYFSWLIKTRKNWLCRFSPICNLYCIVKSILFLLLMMHQTSAWTADISWTITIFCWGCFLKFFFLVVELINDHNRLSWQQIPKD